jgi:hypothetical protein
MVEGVARIGASLPVLNQAMAAVKQELTVVDAWMAQEHDEDQLEDLHILHEALEDAHRELDGVIGQLERWAKEGEKSERFRR